MALPFLALLQGVLGVDSSIQEGIADQKQADLNTQLALNAAADALQRGATEAGHARTDGSQLAARQMVAFANSGVDQTVGTAASVVAATKAQSELQALTIENDAAREAWGYKKHGLQFQTQAGINASRRNREVAGTILGTAGNIANAYGKKGA